MSTVTTPSAESAGDALIPDLQPCAQAFREAPAEVAAIIDGLSEDQFNWRPADDEWAIAEVLDHLIVLGHAMAPKLEEGLQRAEQRGLYSDGPFKYGRLGNLFVTLAGPTEKARKRKFKAPAMYTPTSNHSISRVTTAFNELQEQYIRYVERANGVDLARVKVSSPVTRLLRLSLGQWFAMLAGHQQRHFHQCRHVREHM